jgi:hypothetical protein
MIALALVMVAALSQPPAIDCDQVRAKVNEYGRITALAWAVAHGYSREQIKEARKCLH